MSAINVAGTCEGIENVADPFGPSQMGRSSGIDRYKAYLASPRLGERPVSMWGDAVAVPDTYHEEWETKESAVPLDPGEILVAMLLPIGDTLLATPALGALRRRFPLSNITVLASSSNAGILKDNPTFNQLVVVDEQGSRHRMVRMAKRLSELRQIKYDLVINLSPISSIALMMAGVYQKSLHV